jgi:hypothetical protein
MKLFFIEIPNFWALADNLGVFQQFISTHFGTVSPLSMFSINQSLFIQQTKPLNTNLNYFRGIGI